MHRRVQSCSRSYLIGIAHIAVGYISVGYSVCAAEGWYGGETIRDGKISLFPSTKADKIPVPRVRLSNTRKHSRQLQQAHDAVEADLYE